ncbi:MAG: DEAD/DEAH box helicase [Candidatus Eisenbacteria bacterium]
MDLIASYSTMFSPEIRRKGEPYFRRGRVEIVESEPDLIRANVEGSSLYAVELRLTDKGLNILCDCPAFRGRPGPCKHIWAVMLQARENPGVAPVRERKPKRREAAQAGANWSPNWKQRITNIRFLIEEDREGHTEAWPVGRELIYALDLSDLNPFAPIRLHVLCRDRKLSGEWGKLRPARVPRAQLQALDGSPDGRILATLAGSLSPEMHWLFGVRASNSVPTRFELRGPTPRLIVPEICRTGRAYLLTRAHPLTVGALLEWDESGPWRLKLGLLPSADGFDLDASLVRGDESIRVDQPQCVHPTGLVLMGTRVAFLESRAQIPWIFDLRARPALAIRREEALDFVAELHRLPSVPEIELPREIQLEEARPEMRPHLRVHAPLSDHRREPRLPVELSFDYDGAVVEEGETARSIFRPAERRVILRNLDREEEARARLRELGFRPVRDADSPPEWELLPSRLSTAVAALVEEGWRVEAEGKAYRSPREFRVEVSSGVDWFDLHGTVSFGDVTARLPELLAALRRGDTAIQLGDGTLGLLPVEWLKRFGLAIGMGTAHDGAMRFQRAQVGLLDTLLAAQPEVEVDAVFAQARAQLSRFEGVQAADPPEGFRGQLRAYQRDGLGWLHFLREFGFGGCLADDMGLGKTVMVLALLEARRQDRLRAHSKSGERPGPSLVVVPKSLVWNWKAESQRFTPLLHLHDHTGTQRGKLNGQLDEVDVVITTYGTLRRDAVQFKDVDFDYVILDEAQAIKNPDTDSAKAARLLRAHHRLALSGTPIENHLGELWSLFEFLNPGMLGAGSLFRPGSGGLRNPDDDTRTLLARALRPFVLRRTKDQVALDLPPKNEQTIFCDMEEKQQRLYDELKVHYRVLLAKKIAEEGMGRAKIHVLEALLRLRQAACHPGLLDPERREDSSAKLDLLLPRLAEVMDEGHKAIVFSQFTSLLAIVRERLDADGVNYAYLDGRTRDRAARVEQFQNDPECRLFLVSLKAGGVGLNLTAAEYVFLLDPWWNPAVEMQAIDRAHRIGQTKAVFAYRLIARGSVEEKILELQRTKRDLAEAVITEDNSILRDLGRDDLELLLS